MSTSAADEVASHERCRARQVELVALKTPKSSSGTCFAVLRWGLGSLGCPAPQPRANRCTATHPPVFTVRVRALLGSLPLTQGPLRPALTSRHGHAEKMNKLPFTSRLFLLSETGGEDKSCRPALQGLALTQLSLGFSSCGIVRRSRSKPFVSRCLWCPFPVPSSHASVPSLPWAPGFNGSPPARGGLGGVQQGWVCRVLSMVCNVQANLSYNVKRNKQFAGYESAIKTVIVNLNSRK